MKISIKKTTSMVLTFFLLISSLNINIFGMKSSKQPLLGNESARVGPLGNLKSIFENNSDSSEENEAAIPLIPSAVNEPENVTVVPITVGKTGNNDELLKRAQKNEDILAALAMDVSRRRDTIISDIDDSRKNDDQRNTDVSNHHIENDNFIKNELPKIIKENRDVIERLHGELSQKIKENENLSITVIHNEEEISRLRAELNDKCNVCIPMDTLTCNLFKLRKRCNGKFWNGCFCGTVIAALVIIGCYIIVFVVK